MTWRSRYTSSNEDAIAKMQAAGPGAYDIAWITSPFAQGLIAADGLEPLDEGADPQRLQPVPRGERARLRPREQVLDAVFMGHDRDLLPERPGEEHRDRQLGRPPGAESGAGGKITLIDEDRWILSRP